MGGKGRAPRPTHIRALEGVKEYRLNRDEPVPGDSQVFPPVPMPADAQAVWDRLAPDMIAKKVLTSWDVDLFAVFCRMAALHNRAAAEVARSGMWVDGSVKNTKVVSPNVRIMQMTMDTMRSIGSRYGLTPGDRATLRIDHSGPNTGAELFIT